MSLNSLSLSQSATRFKKENFLAERRFLNKDVSLWVCRGSHVCMRTPNSCLMTRSCLILSVHETGKFKSINKEVVTLFYFIFVFIAPFYLCFYCAFLFPWEELFYVYLIDAVRWESNFIQKMSARVHQKKIKSSTNEWVKWKRFKFWLMKNIFRKP